jgi:gamma-glutamylcyclotransferase (GGCT)/AIG2-like uncharacterized protein YtfP
MACATVRLFVYGSLKRGERHHEELQAAGATFLGEAETVPGYRLEALTETEPETETGYLALVFTDRTGADAPEVVSGELFEVPESQLPALDAFEGDAYSRGVVKLRELKRRARARAGTAEAEAEAEASMESLAYFKKAR